MKIFCISHDEDIIFGMRLAGIEGTLVSNNKNDFENCLEQVIKKKDIAVVLITEKLVALSEEKIFKIKKTLKTPIIVRIPNREGKSDVGKAIAKYINESVGIKIWN